MATTAFLVEDVLGLRMDEGAPVGCGRDGRFVPSGRTKGRADPRLLFQTRN